MSAEPEMPASVWSWLVKGLLAVVLAIGGFAVNFVLSSVSKEIADVKADNSKLWGALNQSEISDRERWEKREAQADAKRERLEDNMSNLRKEIDDKLNRIIENQQKLLENIRSMGGRHGAD